MQGKPFWMSKTFWINFLAIVALIAQHFGFTVGVELQAALLAIVNVILRSVTSESVTWAKQPPTASVTGGES